MKSATNARIAAKYYTDVLEPILLPVAYRLPGDDWTLQREMRQYNLQVQFTCFKSCYVRHYAFRI